MMCCTVRVPVRLRVVPGPGTCMYESQVSSLKSKSQRMVDDGANLKMANGAKSGNTKKYTVVANNNKETTNQLQIIDKSLRLLDKQIK